MKKYSVCLLLAALGACSGEQPDTPPSASHTEVIATVNGMTISEQELTFLKEDMLGQSFIAPDQALNKKLLDSIIASKLMSAAAEDNLTQEEVIDLNLRVARYREELLVKAYINQNATPSPVSDAQVQAFYLENQVQFGATTKKRFKYVTTQGDLSTDQKQQAIGILENRGEQSLESLSDALTNTGIQNRVLQAELRVTQAKPPIKGLLDHTPVGEFSEIVKGQHLILLQVVSETPVAPKPLSEVRAQIREMLAPVQLKKSVKTLTDDIIATANIEYH